MYPDRRHAVRLHVIKMQSCNDAPPTTTAAQQKMQPLTEDMQSKYMSFKCMWDRDKK